MCYHLFKIAKNKQNWWFFIWYPLYKIAKKQSKLERLQDSSNSTSIQSLCRRVKMTEAELRKHSEEYEIFRDGAGAKKTYMEVREQLRLRELSKLKKSMQVEMRKLNKPIRYRRENLLHLWKLREPKVVRTGKITLKNLVSLAKILQQTPPKGRTFFEHFFRP